MIDTVHLTLHNFSNYKFIYNKIFSLNEKKDTFTQCYVDETTGEMQKITYLRQALFHDTGKFVPIAGRASITSPSWHYAVSCLPNYSYDTLQLNFSVPKEIFGNNVMQFIDLYEPKDPKVLYFKFLHYLKQFFYRNFNESPNFFDLEITQIDFCYNHIFASFKDAQLYLNAMDANSKKFAKSTKNTGHSYDALGRTDGDKDSFYYRGGNNYMWKVYLKGIEFQKHDYKKLQKNKRNFTYDLGEFSKKANNILRYELSFRKGQLNYLFDKQFNAGVNDNQYNNLRGGSVDEKNRILSKCRSYRLQHISESNNPFFLPNWDNLHFSRSLFTACFDFFWQKIAQYSLTQVPDTHTIFEKIRKKQETHSILKKAKLQYNVPNITRLLFPALLTRYMSLENLKKMIPERTFYQLKKDLKDLGFDSELTIQDTSIHVTPTDYELYIQQFGFYHHI